MAILHLNFELVESVGMILISGLVELRLLLKRFVRYWVMRYLCWWMLIAPIVQLRPLRSDICCKIMALVILRNLVPTGSLIGLAKLKMH